MARQLSDAVGPTITFVDVPAESMRAALVDLGFPAWRADGLVEETITRARPARGHVQ